MRFLAVLLFVATCVAQPTEIIPVLDDTDIYDVFATGSMEPTFNEHCWLLVKKLPFAGLHVGDIILVSYPWCKAPVSHRVIRLSSGGTLVVTKGDANQVEDYGWATESQYIGTVVGIVRKP